MRELDNLGPALIKLLAVQRMQQLIAEHPDLLVSSTSNGTTHEEAIAQLCQSEDDLKKMPLPSELLTKDDIERIAREFTAANSSALNAKLQSELRKQKQRPNNGSSNGNSINPLAMQDVSDATVTTSSKKDALTELTTRIVNQAQHQQIRVRAALTWINLDQEGYFCFEKVDASDAICMSYRSFTVGSGPGNDVTLAKYGDCCCTSSRHAIIFYDEV